mmetsp:Transcript_16969/g.14899  ORF Transcript_16969/g.14899 Transcript_16969/m.14899 type:complete len:108 (-) Transcript_16969:211-534(-)
MKKNIPKGIKIKRSTSIRPAKPTAQRKQVKIGELRRKHNSTRVELNLNNIGNILKDNAANSRHKKINLLSVNTPPSDIHGENVDSFKDLSYSQVSQITQSNTQTNRS